MSAKASCTEAEASPPAPALAGRANRKLSDLKNAPNSNFNDRLNAAAQARKAVMERIGSMPRADDPALLARQAERQAKRAAREEEAKARRIARAEAQAAEAARLEAAQAAEAAARAAEAADSAAKAEALLAEQKAARDARYAARKARAK